MVLAFLLRRSLAVTLVSLLRVHRIGIFNESRLTEQQETQTQTEKQQQRKMRQTERQPRTEVDAATSVCFKFAHAFCLFVQSLSRAALFVCSLSVRSLVCVSLTFVVSLL